MLIENIKLLNKIFQKIFSNFPEMVYWVNSKNQYLGYNKSYARFINLDNDEYIKGKSVKDTLEKLNIKVKQENFSSPKSTFTTKHYIFNGSKKINIQSRVIFILNTKIYIEKIQQNYEYEIAILKKKCLDLEHEKDKVEAYINNIIQIVPASIYWKDINSIILGDNLLHAKIAGLKNTKQAIGKTDFDFVWKDQAQTIIDNDIAIMNAKKGLKLEENATLNDGKTHTFLTSKEPMFDKNKNVIGIIGVSVDITELKETQKQLKQAKEAAEAANIAKTEFIANMSHDIRTPLSGVVGLGNIAEREIVNPNTRSKVHDMVKSADELLNMLNEILDVVSQGNISVQNINDEPFDIYHLVQTIIDLEQSSVDLKKIKLLKNIDPKIPNILIGDHKKIHHIILNLVGNAIKFTNKGHVLIETLLLNKDDKEVEIAVKISDTGIGIPTESQDKVFDLFYKISPSFKNLQKGHGVGLHIVKTYLDILGSKVTVDSEENKGSTFSFTLKLAIAPPGVKHENIIQENLNIRAEEPPILTQQTTFEESSSPNNDAPNILVIEDNEIARQIAKTLILDVKCNPVTAEDGETALKLIKKQKFDLILTDIGLPGISGNEFAKQFRAFEKQKHSEHTPIVALTGHAEGVMRDECLASGINDVIIKPIRPDILNKLLEDLQLTANHNSQVEQISRKQSSDLPKTADGLFAIDNELIFDISSAKKILGEKNSGIIMQMLKDTVNITIPGELPHLQKAYAEKDWESIAKIAHKLKGGFLAISLNRAAVACKYMERYYRTGETKLLDKLYKQMLQTLRVTVQRIGEFI